MAIKKIKMIDGKTTVYEIYGDIIFNDLFGELIDYYENHLSLNCIWDFTHGSIFSLTKEQINKLAAKEAEYSSKRIGGKNAWVAPDKLTFGLCRMIQEMCRSKNSKLELEVFHSKAKALRWISSNS